MYDYSFLSLNDKEFEKLCKDLLNSKFNLALQDFKMGKDRGIDLRYSSQNNNNSVIVQAKHYAKSSYVQLKHVMKHEELNKINALKPDRYIVTTSISLSSHEKDELKSILSPWVLTSNDIISREDLNGYLSEFKEIEIKYFKLWFSSLTVFNSILNNAIEGRSRSYLEKISQNISIYVITKKLDEAYKILNKEKLLLISGQPGIGKTTLAEIILVSWAKVDFKIYKVENITEAEDVISISDDEKQLFFFDDFLGANYVEIVNAHKTETQLTSFVERIKNSPNKYLLLTTRTVILNQAVEKYEKIHQSRIANKQFELRLTDYSRYEKALILYNHLYFRNIKEDFFNSIIDNQFYKKIIDHRNYTPRIIDFITNKSIINEFSIDHYRQYIINNLNNPKEIWRYSINNQINYLDKCLLITLFTFSGGVVESSLLKAFEKRLEFEKIEHNQIINSNQFLESLKILLNGFITSRLVVEYNYRFYDFINPSLTDYFLGYLSESYEERKSAISSVLYFEQLKRFDLKGNLIPLEKDLQIIIRDKINSNQLLIAETYFHNSDIQHYALILETLCKYCNDINIDSLLLKYLELIDFTSSIKIILSKLNYVLMSIKDSPLTIQYIQTNFIMILEGMMASTWDLDIAKNIPDLFSKYSQNYDEYYESDSGFDKLITVVENTLKAQEQEIIEDKGNSITDENELNEMYSELEDIENDLRSKLFLTSSFVYDFGITPNLDDWSSKMKENAERIDRETEDSEGFDSHYEHLDFNPLEEEHAIDDLFTRF
jgi:Holliday junction resolvasome RuvABC ATP-dependent DNA helicase subunit